MVIGPSAKRNVVGLVDCCRKHRFGGGRGHSLVAAGAIDDVGPQGNAGELLFVPIDPRGAFVGLLVDAIQRGGVTNHAVADFAAIAVGGVIDGYR